MTKHMQDSCKVSQYYFGRETDAMSVKTENGLENTQQEPELSRKRETDWMKVLFQIQVSLSAVGAIHFLLKDSYWSTIIFGKYFF